MSYLVDKYKGKYRILSPYNLNTNQYNRKLDGTFEDIDLYIQCSGGIKIFYYGSSILEVYIPSIGKGRNIIKTIYSEYINPSNTEVEILNSGRKSIKIIDLEKFQEELEDINSIIWNVRETDEEVLFWTLAKNIGTLEKYLKPKISGANISPFSTKNLPKNKINIPDEQLDRYKEIIKNVPSNCLLNITHRTNDFIKTILTKKKSMEDIKNDMALKGLKGKEYIYLIGEWDNYITYLKENL